MNIKSFVNKIGTKRIIKKVVNIKIKFDSYERFECFKKVNRKEIRITSYGKELLGENMGEWVLKEGTNYYPYYPSEEKGIVPKRVRGLVFHMDKLPFFEENPFGDYILSFRINRLKLLLKKRDSKIKPSHIAVFGKSQFFKLYLKDYKIESIVRSITRKFFSREDKTKNIFNEEIKDMKEEIEILSDKSCLLSKKGDDNRKIAIFALEKKYRRTFSGLLKDDDKKIERIKKEIKKKSRYLDNYTRIANVLTNLQAL